MARRCTRVCNIGAIFNRRKARAERQLLLPGTRGRLGFGGINMVLSILLVCAVVASLGVGVLVAYGICLGMFRVFRIHATQVAARRVSALGAGGLRVVGN